MQPVSCPDIALETQVLLYRPEFLSCVRFPPYLIAASRTILPRRPSSPPGAPFYVRMVIQHLIRFARRRPVHPRQRRSWLSGRCSRYTGCCFFSLHSPASSRIPSHKTSSGYTAFLPHPARASHPPARRRTRTRSAVRCSPDDRHFRQPVLRVSGSAACRCGPFHHYGHIHRNGNAAHGMTLSG